MQISITSRLPKVPDNACQIVFVHSDSKLKGTARKIDTECNGLIQQLFDAKDFNGEPGETLLLHGVSEYHAARILLVGLGERAVLDAERWRNSCARAAEALSKTPAETLISDALATVDIDNSDKAVMAEHLVREIASAQYQFTLHQKLDQLQSLTADTPDGEDDEQPHATTESDNEAPHLQGLGDSVIIGQLCDDSATPKTLILSTERKQLDVISEAADAALATAYGMATARDLGNLAPNYCTPSFLANLAERMAAQHDRLTTDILDEATMHTLGMNALLSVSAGSAQPARLIVMNYKGRKRAGSPIVLVGKGITFDTGGISIKPSSGMDEMKYDMCGAASVFGVIDSLCRLNADVNVIGVVAAAENMPGGKATRPGDVVTSLSGKTIEILNTDAEGRLVLADALSYCEQFKPASVVDIATLTGACIVALGHETSAVMGNHQPTIAALQAAGDRSGDKTWPLPLNEDYRQLLKSNFADMANIGGKGAGAITAGCFLSHFTESLHWAHLDIAGVAWKSGEHKGATGRPVPLLMSYILQSQ